MNLSIRSLHNQEIEHIVIGSAVHGMGDVSPLVPTCQLQMVSPILHSLSIIQANPKGNEIWQIHAEFQIESSHVLLRNLFC